jgi:hypothetical protein
MASPATQLARCSACVAGWTGRDNGNFVCGRVNLEDEMRYLVLLILLAGGVYGIVVGSSVERILAIAFVVLGSVYLGTVLAHDGV